MFHCIAEGEAREGDVVAYFDGGKPGGRDWVSGGGMVEVDECAGAGEVVGIVGLTWRCGGGLSSRGSTRKNAIFFKCLWTNSEYPNSLKSMSI